MGNANSLIKKIKRRQAYANRHLAHLKDRIDMRDEVMGRSPGVYDLFRGILRHIDKNFGKGSLPSPTKIKQERLLSVDDLDRFDFGTSDFGIRLRRDIPLAGVKEVTHIGCIAEAGQYEISLITCVATASAAQGDYFVFESPAAETYAVWLDINANGTAPTGAAYVASTHQVQASIVTGGTATQNRDIILAAIGTIANMTIVATSTNQITITANTFANRANTVRHNTGDTGNGSFVVATSQGGVASTLNSTYFTIQGISTSFYVWMNTDSKGVDPAVAGKTGIPVALTAPMTNANVGTAVKNALDAKVDFVATNVSQNVVVTVQSAEAEVDVADGAAPTGFSFSVATQGVTQVNDTQLSDIGAQPGDVVEVLTGANAGKQYNVVTVVDGSTLRLEDDSTFGIAETDIEVKIKLAGSKRTYE